VSRSKQQDSPIIIKRVKKGGHGHHGGSWKVAYADFVTAMMALFLLMWLLVALTDSQKEQVSSLFRGEKPAWVDSGEGGAALPKGVEGAMDVKTSEVAVVQIALGIKELVSGDPSLRNVSGISADDTGVYLHMDAPALFEPSSVKLTPCAARTLDRIAVFLRSHNVNVAIRGHASTRESIVPFASRWELAAARAAVCTEYLATIGRIPGDRLVASAYSDSQPLVPDAQADADQKNARVDFFYFSPDVQGR